MSKIKVTIYVEDEMWDMVKEIARARAHQYGEPISASEVVRDSLRTLVKLERPR